MGGCLQGTTAEAAKRIFEGGVLTSFAGESPGGGGVLTSGPAHRLATGGWIYKIRADMVNPICDRSALLPRLKKGGGP